MSLERFLVSQQEWSQATFGTKEVRGPLGPLDHLKKEIEETIIEAQNIAFSYSLLSFKGNKLAHEALLEELVDCFFLIMDAVWRAGFTQEQFEAALWEKLRINRERKWPPLNEQDPTKAAEHER